MDLFAYMLGKNAGGGGSEQEDGLVTRTLTAYENSKVSNVGDIDEWLEHIESM